MNSIRVGVIGVGAMGERHCRVYSNMRGVQMVGVADQDTNRGETVATRYGTHYFEDHQRLLAKIDAVSIATTTHTHFDLAMEALEQRVHLLVEKPLTETMEQGARLVAKAERNGRILQVGYIERFNPAYIELKNVIGGMQLVAINIRRLSPFDLSNTDVDVIHDLMIHDLDLIVDLIGTNPECLQAWGRSMLTDVIDHAVAVLSCCGPK